MCQLNSLMLLLINSENYITGAWPEVDFFFFLDSPSSREITISYILYASTYGNVDA